MKVKIGSYKNWIGPYQLAERTLFWLDKHTDDRVDKLGDWFSQNGTSWITKVCTFIDNKRHRKIKVHIDEYDIWDMSSTLSLVIAPMLRKMKEDKHGAPNTDDADVPEELKSTSAPPPENKWDPDDNHFKRWEWILNEMCWAFDQLEKQALGTEDWEDQYHSGKHDYSFVGIDEKGDKTADDVKPKFYQYEKGPNDTYVFDSVGYKKHSERIQNGTILFGKYYRNLWT